MEVRIWFAPLCQVKGKKTAGSVAHVYPASDSGVLELPGPDGFRTRPPHRIRGLEDPGTSSGSWRAGPTCLPSLPLHLRNLVIVSLTPVFGRRCRARAGDGRKLAFGHRHLRRRRRRRVTRIWFAPLCQVKGKKTAGSVAHVYPASDSGVLELPGPDGFAHARLIASAVSKTRVLPQALGVPVRPVCHHCHFTCATW